MKEIIHDLIKSSSARIKHPLIGSFIITHIVYNWNYYLILIFSDLSIENKIFYIKSHTNYWNFIIPFIISAFYVTCFPYINNIINNILEKAKIDENNNKENSVKRIMKVKLLEANFERQIAEEKAGTKELELLKKQIESTKNQIENLYKEKEELIEINKKSNLEYNAVLRELENQKEMFNKSRNIDFSILEDVENLNNSAKQLLSKFYKYYKTNRLVRIEPNSGDFKVAEELVAKNLVRKEVDLFDNNNYELTDLGKIYIQLLRK